MKSVLFSSYLIAGGSAAALLPTSQSPFPLWSLLLLSAFLGALSRAFHDVKDRSEVVKTMIVGTFLGTVSGLLLVEQGVKPLTASLACFAIAVAGIQIFYSFVTRTPQLADAIVDRAADAVGLEERKNEK
jgi:hypothetical protein